MSVQITLEPETRTQRLLIEFKRDTVRQHVNDNQYFREQPVCFPRAPAPLSLYEWDVLALLALVQMNRYFGSHIWLILSAVADKITSLDPALAKTVRSQQLPF